MTGADPRLARVKRGDPITAKGWNAVIDQVAVRPLPAQTTRPLFQVANGAGEDIPGFSVLIASAPTKEAYSNILTMSVVKPQLLTYQLHLQTVLTNGPNEILSGKTGLASFIDPWCPVMLIAGGTIAAGDVVGAESSFRVSIGAPGFIALHAATVGNPVWCISDVNHNGWAAALTTTSVSARSGTTPGSGGAELKKLSSTTLTTTETVTVRSVYGAIIAPGTWITVSRDLLGTYWVLGADCP